MKNNDNDWFWDTIFVITICFVAFCIGVGMGSSKREQQAIDHNVAYYNSTNKNFEWRTVTNKW